MSDRDSHPRMISTMTTNGICRPNDQFIIDMWQCNNCPILSPNRSMINMKLVQELAQNNSQV